MLTAREARDLCDELCWLPLPKSVSDARLDAYRTAVLAATAARVEGLPRTPWQGTPWVTVDAACAAIRGEANK